MKTILIPTILALGLGLGGCSATMMAHGGSSGMGPSEGHGAGHFERMHAMHDTDAAAFDATAILQAYSDAVNLEDVAAMEALTVADERFSIIEGGHANWGWVDYRDNHLAPEFASERFQINTYGFSDINVRAGHLIAYATFAFAFEATLDGEPYNKEGLGTAVLRRTPDGWRIAHLQTS